MSSRHINIIYLLINFQKRRSKNIQILKDGKSCVNNACIHQNSNLVETAECSFQGQDHKRHVTITNTDLFPRSFLPKCHHFLSRE